MKRILTVALLGLCGMAFAPSTASAIVGYPIFPIDPVLQEQFACQVVKRSHTDRILLLCQHMDFREMTMECDMSWDKGANRWTVLPPCRMWSKGVAVTTQQAEEALKALQRALNDSGDELPSAGYTSEDPTVQARATGFAPSMRPASPSFGFPATPRYVPGRIRSGTGVIAAENGGFKTGVSFIVETPRAWGYYRNIKVDDGNGNQYHQVVSSGQGMHEAQVNLWYRDAWHPNLGGTPIQKKVLIRVADWSYSGGDSWYRFHYDAVRQSLSPQERECIDDGGTWNPDGFCE